MHHDTIVKTHPHLHLGRKRRIHNKLVHFGTLAAALGKDVSKPIAFDWTAGLPKNTGALLNDQLGCCAFAAKYHRLQAMVFKLSGQFIDPAKLEPLVLQFYEKAGGYVQGDQSTDQGGDMQDICEYLLKTGLPMLDGKPEKFVGCFEINTGHQGALSYCGDVCGGIDLGIQVTTSVMPADGSDPPEVWDVSPDDQVLGGHDIYALGRLPNGNWIVDSWGSFYQLTPSFWQKNIQEAYGYVSKDWCDAMGKTPLGMSLDQWEAAMTAHAETV